MSQKPAQPRLISYQAKPERADENERLIRAVFAELAQARPDGIRYLALKVGDQGFVHLVIADSEEANKGITSLEAFKAFQNGIRDRQSEPGQFRDVVVLGNYRVLAE